MHWELNDSNILKVFTLKYIDLCLLHKRTSSFNNLRASLWRKCMGVLLWELCHALNTDRRIYNANCRWKWTRKKVPDTGSHGVQALISLSGRSFHIGLSDKRRPERERQSLGNLQPRASWRTGEEMHRMYFSFLFSHLRILSSPRALRSVEHPRSPALPPLCVRTKIV